MAAEPGEKATVPLKAAAALRGRRSLTECGDTADTRRRTRGGSMAHDRRFRFGLQASTAPDAAGWAALARKVEDMGFSSLFLPDHFGDQLAPVPAMMAAADATESLRVGTLVFDNDYKHPVVLAKEMATIDVLSGGRVELGLGAGWMTSDYEQSGIAHDSPGVRVSRMEEGIAVIKGLFAPDPLSFSGEHYQVTGLDGQPKPLQQPGPPILIGGGGRRVLSIAAREADIVGINPSMKAGVVGPEAAADATGEATDAKIGWVRDAAGDRFDDIELNALAFAVMVTDERDEMCETMAGMFAMEPSAVADVHHVWIGSVEEICEDLQRWRDRWGISYFVVQRDALEAVEPIVARLTGT